MLGGSNRLLKMLDNIEAEVEKEIKAITERLRKEEASLVAIDDMALDNEVTIQLSGDKRILQNILKELNVEREKLESQYHPADFEKIKMNIIQSLQGILDQRVGSTLLMDPALHKKMTELLRQQQGIHKKPPSSVSFGPSAVRAIPGRHYLGEAFSIGHYNLEFTQNPIHAALKEVYERIQGELEEAPDNKDLISALEVINKIFKDLEPLRAQWLARRTSGKSEIEEIDRRYEIFQKEAQRLGKEFNESKFISEYKTLYQVLEKEFDAYAEKEKAIIEKYLQASPNPLVQRYLAFEMSEFDEYTESLPTMKQDEDSDEDSEEEVLSLPAREQDSDSDSDEEDLSLSPLKLSDALSAGSLPKKEEHPPKPPILTRAEHRAAEKKARHSEPGKENIAPSSNQSESAQSDKDSLVTPTKTRPQ